MSYLSAQVVRQAKYLVMVVTMVANIDTTKFFSLIVLVTNWAMVRDLEVSVPPNFMSFPRASLWGHTESTYTQYYWVSRAELGLGTVFRWS